MIMGDFSFGRDLWTAKKLVRESFANSVGNERKNWKIYEKV